MGNISNYCPHCGSQKVYTVEIDFQVEGDLSFTLESENEELWYECGDCHSEWEAHHHHATHRMIGTHDC